MGTPMEGIRAIIDRNAMEAMRAIIDRNEGDH